MELSGKRVLVLGLGETGLSMARFLVRRGAHPRVADTRAAPPSAAALRVAVPQAEIVPGPFVERLLDGIDLVALSPGVPLGSPLPQAAMARGMEIVGDIELFARVLAADATVIAITGTNGKTTVTALVGELARAGGLDCEVAGNIGPAALDALMAREDAGMAPSVWVLELSSFQLETTASLAASAATVLNVTEDHLDRYAGIAAYAAAKARIFAGGGAQVLNRDDPRSLAMALPGRQVITFGLDTPREATDFGLVKVSGEHWLARGTTPLVKVSELQLTGMHNAANAMAALALCKAIDLNCGVSLPVLRYFRGLPHRVERVAEIAGVTYFDDSKGTNVGATVAALAGFARQLAASAGRVVLIAGGDGKQQDFSPLKDAVVAAARGVVLIGRDAPVIEAVLAETAAACGIRVERAASMETAVARAATLARPGDAVLLSPACASFDMFRDYAHRGAAFSAAVRAMAEHATH